MVPNNPKLSALIRAAAVNLGDSKAQLMKVLRGAITDHKGNLKHTARALDMGLQSLQRLLVKYPPLRTHADNEREAERLRYAGPRSDGDTTD